MNSYRHTQFGSALVYPLLGIALVTFAAGVISSHLGLVVAPAIPLLIVALLFWNLTLSVDDKYLRASFGPGLVRKAVSLDEIASCEPFRIRWWEGWGIHLSRHGWLYNVSGWGAVAIRLRNGRELSFGTDDPEGLARALAGRRS